MRRADWSFRRVSVSESLRGVFLVSEAEELNLAGVTMLKKEFGCSTGILML